MKTLKAVLSITIGNEGKRSDCKRVIITLGNPLDIVDAHKMKCSILEWNPDLPVEGFIYTETTHI